MGRGCLDLEEKAVYNTRGCGGCWDAGLKGPQVFNTGRHKKDMWRVMSRKDVTPVEVRVVGVEGWRGPPADGDDGPGHGMGNGEAVQLRGHCGGVLVAGPVPLRREGGGSFVGVCRSKSRETNWEDSLMSGGKRNSGARGGRSEEGGVRVFFGKMVLTDWWNSSGSGKSCGVNKVGRTPSYLTLQAYRQLIWQAGMNERPAHLWRQQVQKRKKRHNAENSVSQREKLPVLMGANILYKLLQCLFALCGR